MTTKFMINGAQIGVPGAPFDPTHAEWDSVGDESRGLTGRLLTTKRKGITLFWGPMAVGYCDTLMAAYYALRPVYFQLESITIPPKRGITTSVWQAYTGFPVADQKIWADEPTFRYVGAWVEDFAWHFGNVTGLVTP